jgi:signal transduction histidine kinase
MPDTRLLDQPTGKVDGPVISEKPLRTAVERPGKEQGMNDSPKTVVPSVSNIHLLLAYVADLELEVDRLRKQGQLVQHEARETLKRIRLLCSDTAPTHNGLPPVAEIEQAAKHLGAVLRDLHEPPGYHPAHDQVMTIAVRPLIEQVFRWQQRLVSAPEAVLHVDLETENVDWFPARLRHILDNLISNALKYRDPDKGETRVLMSLRVSASNYELRISDNGVGLRDGGRPEVFELFYRAAPARAAGLGVGLAVVKLLVEQSGGTLGVESDEGQGTSFVATLPRYDVDDYLT